MKRNVSGLTLKCGFWGNMGPCFCNFPVTVYPMGRRACEGQIWKKQVAAFSRWGFLIFAGPSDHIASLRHQAPVPATAGAIGAWRPQAPFRRPTAAPGGGSWAGDGRSSVLHRRKGDDERGHTLSSEDLRPAAVGLTSFVGRCPAACRRVILLSSPKEESRKQRKKCHRLGWTFSGIPPRVLLLSSLKDCKQRKVPPFRRGGRRPGSRAPWTPHSGNYQMPLPPASTRPTLRAGGSGLSAKEKMKSIGPAACKEKASVYRSCCRTFHPACKVRPGAAGGGMADRSSWAGVQRISSSGRRPPVRKGGRLFRFLFGRSKRNIHRRMSAEKLQPFQTLAPFLVLLSATKEE